jgi:hypothetical protein
MDYRVFWLIFLQILSWVLLDRVKDPSDIHDSCKVERSYINYEVVKIKLSYE